MNYGTANDIIVHDLNLIYSSQEKHWIQFHENDEKWWLEPIEVYFDEQARADQWTERIPDRTQPSYEPL